MSYSIRYIFRHIARQRTKSVLTVLAALLFVIALGFLQETINRTESEIDHLFETIIVSAEIRMDTFAQSPYPRLLANVIRPRTVHSVLNSGFVRNTYMEASHLLGVVISEDKKSITENWGELGGSNLTREVWGNFSQANYLFAFSNKETYFAAHSRGPIDELPGVYRTLPSTPPGQPPEPLAYLYFTYGYGFSYADFVFTAGEPIPLVVSEPMMELRGLNVGDKAVIGFIYGREERWMSVPAIIIGVHNRNLMTALVSFRDTSFMPLAAMEYILGDETSFIVLHFEIEPAYAREIPWVYEELLSILNLPLAGWANLRLTIYDEELRSVVLPMEQNLSLLRALYPFALGITFLAGLGLSLLLMLQNAKNAAILRALGSSGFKSCVNLLAEQWIVTLFGLIIGILAVAFLGWGFGGLSMLTIAGIYFAGTILGSATGAILISVRKPMELLQVKE